MNPSSSFLEVNQQTLDRQAHLLDGIKHFTDNSRLNSHEINRTAVLLDNAEADFCSRKQITRTQLEAMKTEANVNVSGDAAAFIKIQLPLIRKIYPALISREFVSVQPMSQPTMKIFYHDIQRMDTNASMSGDPHARRAFADHGEHNEAAPVAVKRIGMKITSDSVSATEKKLMYENTVEAQQDFMSQHGISLDSELTDALSMEIVREWDRMIIEAMLTDATGGTSSFSAVTPAGISYTDRKVWMESLMESFIDVDTQIYGKSYRQTNFIIIPHTVAGFMSKAAGFVVNPVSPEQQIIQTGGRYFMGTLNNRWRVYVDPFITKCLIGFNDPNNWMYTSFVWSPYILSYFSDPFTDPETFVTKKAIMSRAAMKTVRPDLLGTVDITWV